MPMVTDRPILIVANGMSGTCSAGFIPDLHGQARLLVDGMVEGLGGLGVATMAVPTVGAHDVLLEYDVFDCPDTFCDERLTFEAGDRMLLAASGPRRMERVTAIDLAGRYDPIASQLLVINLAPRSGSVPYVVDGPAGRYEGTLGFEEIAITPVTPGEVTTITMTSMTTLSDTSRWRTFGIDMVICVLRATRMGGEEFECTAGSEYDRGCDTRPEFLPTVTGSLGQNVSSNDTPASAPAVPRRTPKRRSTAGG